MKNVHFLTHSVFTYKSFFLRRQAVRLTVKYRPTIIYEILGQWQIQMFSLGVTWRARERESITGGLRRSPQRGPGAQPLVRRPGAVRGICSLNLKTFFHWNVQRRGKHSLTFRVRPYIGFVNFRNFNGENAREDQTASPCQMSWRSAKVLRRYGDFFYFSNMAAVRHLGFVLSVFGPSMKGVWWSLSLCKIWLESVQ